MISWKEQLSSRLAIYLHSTIVLMMTDVIDIVVEHLLSRKFSVLQHSDIIIFVHTTLIKNPFLLQAIQVVIHKLWC